MYVFTAISLPKQRERRQLRIPNYKAMELDGLMKDILLSEIIEADVRAKRFLRVLQHQEARINLLSNELAKKSNLLEKLQDQHSDLVEVYDHQQEVQALQRQLMRLQQDDYFSLIAKSKSLECCDADSQCSGDFSCRKPKACSADENESGPLKSIKAKGSTRNKSKVQFLSPPAAPSLSASTLPAAEQPVSYEKGNLTEMVKSNMHVLGFSQSQKSSSSALGNRISNSEDDTELQVVHETKPYHCGSGGDVDVGSSRMSTSVQVVASRCNGIEEDDDEQIRILRETLSSHKQSITNLSREVIELRQEREELYSCMRQLVKTVTSSKSLNREEDVNANMKLGCEKDDDYRKRNGQSDFKKRTVKDQICETETNVRFRSYQRHERDSDLTGDKTEDGNKPDPDLRRPSYLEMRAKRLWETACRFFTPKQAHFILTAPTPSDPSSDDDDTEDS